MPAHGHTRSSQRGLARGSREAQSVRPCAAVFVSAYELISNDSNFRLELSYLTLCFCICIPPKGQSLPQYAAKHGAFLLNPRQVAIRYCTWGTPDIPVPPRRKAGYHALYRGLLQLAETTYPQRQASVGRQQRLWTSTPKTSNNSSLPDQKDTQQRLRPLTHLSTTPLEGGSNAGLKHLF